jgi:O-antigen/teichoic acid export membrane protein
LVTAFVERLLGLAPRNVKACLDPIWQFSGKPLWCRRETNLPLMSLAHGAARGAAWNLVTAIAERSIGFAVLVILLRHITAADVGLVAIGSAISELARMISSGGSGEQVIAAPGDRSIEAGAFWAQFLLAIGFAAALIAIAPLIAQLYGEPRLTWVIQALAVNIITGCFLIVPSARLAQLFRYRALSVMSLGSTITGGATALALVYTHHGILALITQRMVGIAFYAAVASFVARWAPPAPPRLEALRQAFRFNLPMMGAAFVDYIAVSGYVMLVGLRLPVIEVGQFRIAQRLTEVLQELAIFPASKVFLPVFVSVREDAARRFKVARDLCDALAILSFGVAAVAGAAAKPIVLLMFGARWASAIPVFSVMTLIIPATALYAFVNPMLTALQRPALVWSFALVNAATVAIAALTAAPFGLVPLAWALALRGALAALLLLPALSIGIGRPAWPLLRLFIVPFLALVAARWATSTITANIGELHALRLELLAQAGIAAIVFSLIVLLLAYPRTVALITRVRGIFLRQPAAITS